MKIPYTTAFERYKTLYDLTDEEQRVVIEYSDEYYTDLNAPSNIESDVQYDRALLLHTIRKIGKYQVLPDKVYAGVSFPMTLNWKLNRFRSTTVNPKSAFSDSIKITIIRPTDGAMINNLSYYEQEEEFLIVPGMCFKCVDWTRHYDYVQLIYIETNDGECHSYKDNPIIQFNKGGPIESLGETEFMYKCMTSDDPVALAKETTLDLIKESDIFNKNCIMSMIGQEKQTFFLDYCEELVKHDWWGANSRDILTRRSTFGDNIFTLVLKHTNQSDVMRFISDMYVDVPFEDFTDLEGRNIDMLMKLYARIDHFDVTNPQLDWKDIYGRNIAFYDPSFTTKDVDHQGNTPLLYNTIIKRLKFIKRMKHREMRRSMDVVNYMGQHPLTVANGKLFGIYLDVVKINGDISILTQDDSNGVSPIHNAATFNVKMLQRCAELTDLAIVNRLGESPYYAAIYAGELSTMTYLMLELDIDSLNTYTTYGRDLYSMIRGLS